MKTISEFMKEDMIRLDESEIEKRGALSWLALPAMTTLPLSIGAIGGKIHSDFSSPAAGEYENFEADLVERQLKDVLAERERRKRLDKLKEVLRGSQRSVRL